MEILEQIYNIEIDKDLPIEIREKYHIPLEKIEIIREKLANIIDGFYILSTCNRVSFYFINNNTSPDKIQQLIFPDINCKFRQGIEAIKHFFKTACGLESQIFAETDVIHQIKQYYKNQKGFINHFLEEMINFSFSVHKDFHSSILPKIKKEKQNLANIVHNRIKNLPPDTPIILIGYGFVNKSIHKKIKNDFRNITIFSNNHKGAYPKHKLLPKLKEIEHTCVIISATNTTEFIIEKDYHIPPGALIFDLSVPRSINPQISNNYIDLDKLKENSTNDISDEKIIHTFLNQKVNEFINKIVSSELNSNIKKFYEIPLQIADNKINQYYKELINIFNTSDERKIKEFFKYVNQKIINKALEEPIKKIKELYIINKKRKIIIGTRGSKLALAQTEQILEMLKLYFPEFEFIIKIIKTSGDKNIYTNNSFVKELEEALVVEEIDIAVHSFKDLPYKINEYLEIAAVPLRTTPNDVLITKDGKNLWEMQPNSIIGTSSPRRKTQLQKLRKDIIVKEIRGNIDTRIKKLFQGEYDGIVVAYAGIERLKLEKLISHIFTIEEMVPAPAQGAIALQTRKKSFITQILRKIDNPQYRQETEIERYFMGLMNLGCSFPLGANAQKKENNNIEFHYFVNINNRIYKGKTINPQISEITDNIKQSLLQQCYIPSLHFY